MNARYFLTGIADKRGYTPLPVWVSITVVTIKLIQHMKSNELQTIQKQDIPKRSPCNIATMSDADLLNNLLHANHRSGEHLNSGESLLQTFGGLRGLNIASRMPAYERQGLDDRCATLLQVVMELVRRQLMQSLQRGVSLTSPAATIEYLQTVLRDRKREIFTCLFLDTRHRVIAAEDLFQGSIDGACVYPRIVAERALRLSAAAVIVAHNHPSGVSEPSLADQAITRRLKDALLLLEIRLLDHFVVGDGPPVSMASRGML